MINRQQFMGLVETQILTNEAYYGSKWNLVWNDNSIRNSIYREYAEFLDEVETAWHCYKPNPNFNKTKAVYELVDIVHFMLCSLVNKYHIDVIEAEASFENYPQLQHIQNAMFTDVEYYFTKFMHQRRPSPRSLIYFLSCACTFLDIDDETYIKAHMRKNERNRLRASSGVLEGKYDKSKELPLTLEF